MTDETLTCYLGMDGELEDRGERLRKAGPRDCYTFQEFMRQMIRIGLNVYEKQILPVELCQKAHP